MKPFEAVAGSSSLFTSQSSRSHKVETRPTHVSQHASAQCLRRTCTHIYDHAIAETRILSVHLVKAAQTLERRLAVREATATGAVVGELIVLDDRRRIERLCR